MRGMGAGSVRADRVARWFGVEGDWRRGAAGDMEAPSVRLIGGRIVLLSGPSGGGKSRLLRRIRREAGRGVEWVDVGRIGLSRRPVIEVMTMAIERGRGISVERDEAGEEALIVEGLRALSRVGLGEVWTYLRRPGELSEGQRWRLRLAVAMARGGVGWG